jgi:hypothetical protein
MRRVLKRRWLLLLAGLVAFAAGCNRQDTECLARIGRKTIGRSAGMTGDFRNCLTSGWQGVCSTLDESSVETRVSARLRWEQSLAESRLEVRLKDGAIELSGTVADLTSRRRAVALAESTAGVSKVVDLLQLPEQAQ